MVVFFIFLLISDWFSSSVLLATYMSIFLVCFCHWTTYRILLCLISRRLMLHKQHLLHYTNMGQSKPTCHQTQSHAFGLLVPYSKTMYIWLCVSFWLKKYQLAHVFAFVFAFIAIVPGNKRVQFSFVSLGRLVGWMVGRFEILFHTLSFSLSLSLSLGYIDDDAMADDTVWFANNCISESLCLTLCSVSNQKLEIILLFDNAMHSPCLSIQTSIVYPHSTVGHMWELTLWVLNEREKIGKISEKSSRNSLYCFYMKMNLCGNCL